MSYENVSPGSFFHYFFPNSAIISATDGAPRIFAHHLMLRCDSNPDTTANRPLTTHPDNSSPTTLPRQLVPQQLVP